LPHLLKRECAHIVNISSMGGFFPFREQTIYGASKAAVKLFSEGLYTELIDTNVAVSVVFPGAIDTRITQNSDVTLDIQASDVSGLLKPLSPERAAMKIIKGMERDKFQIYVGIDSNMMNIFYRTTPLLATKFMSSIMKAVMPE
jgi:short-subunit dehydrogenase